MKARDEKFSQKTPENEKPEPVAMRIVSSGGTDK